MSSRNPGIVGSEVDVATEVAGPSEVERDLSQRGLGEELHETMRLPATAGQLLELIGAHHND
jgi:hypothetical protein